MVGNIVNHGTSLQAIGMAIRLRFPEFLEERGLTGYRLSIATRGRVSLSTIYRWVRARGRVRTIDTALLDAICEAFDASLGDVLEMETKRRRGVRRGAGGGS
jgi:DNA-binding Xre family transcriptional regulator